MAATANVTVNTKGGGSNVTGIFLGFLIIIIIGIIAFVAYRVRVSNRRKKLVKWFEDKLKEKNIQVDHDYIQKQADRLNNNDVNTLLKFTAAIDAKDYGTVASMLSEVHGIIFSKTDLGIIGGVLGIQSTENGAT